MSTMYQNWVVCRVHSLLEYPPPGANKFHIPIACHWHAECRKVIVDSDFVESLHIFTIIISVMGFLWLAASAFPSREWTKTAA